MYHSAIIIVIIWVWREQTRGSNSNTGKMDKTLSRFIHTLRSSHDALQVHLHFGYIMHSLVWEYNAKKIASWSPTKHQSTTSTTRNLTSRILIFEFSVFISYR
mgnify:CR=1 FL=1